MITITPVSPALPRIWVEKNGLDFPPPNLVRDVNKTSNDYLTVMEAAAWLSLPVTVVRRWCHNGKLPALQSGKTWLIRLEDLRRMAATHQPVNNEKKPDRDG